MCQVTEGHVVVLLFGSRGWVIAAIASRATFEVTSWSSSSPISTESQFRTQSV